MEKLNTLKRFGALAIAVALIAISTASFTSADEEDAAKRGPNFNPELHEQMVEVMENGDYQDWYDLINQDGHNPKFAETITEENFSQFVEMWNLRQEGRALMLQAREKMEAARAIGEELGLKMPNKRQGNNGVGKGAGGGKIHNRGEGPQE